MTTFFCPRIIRIEKVLIKCGQKFIDLYANKYGNQIDEAFLKALKSKVITDDETLSFAQESQ